MNTPMTKYQVAAEVRAAMARASKRQNVVALATGRSQSYISRRLTGEQPFDIDDLDRVAALLDVPITDFFATVAVTPGTPDGSPSKKAYVDSRVLTLVAA